MCKDIIALRGVLCLCDFQPYGLPVPGSILGLTEIITRIVLAKV